MSYRKSVTTSYIIVLSSLAIILTLIKAEIPYPFLPYLKFDFAEVPVMFLLMAGGLGPALVAETIHWMGLTIRAGSILGPLMKYLAVIPMLVGFWLGIETCKRFTAGREAKSLTVVFGVGMLMGIIIRVIVCSITNTVIFLLIEPRYLTYAGSMLKVIGINVSSDLEILMWTLLLTAVFNSLHVPFSSVIAIITFKAAISRIPALAEKSWISLREGAVQKPANESQQRTT
ncbi:MAG: hypothetical protein QXL38_01780 [Candidatus Bathyarchaeia archaeon]